MKVSDAISGAVFMLLAAAVFWFTKDFRQMPGQNYGAAFFPRTIATCMAGLGLVLVVRGLRAGGPWAVPFDWLGSPRHVANFALVVAVLVAYILTSDWLGFPVAGFAALLILLLWLRGPAHWLQAVIVSLVCVVGMQAFFGEVLRVPLPWGLLQPVAW